MTNLIDQPQNQPFFNKYTSFEQLKKIAKKSLVDFSESVLSFETSELKDEELLKYIETAERKLVTKMHEFGTIAYTHPKKEWRDFCQNIEEEITEVLTLYSLNEKVYKKFTEQIDPSKLTDASAKRLYGLSLRSYLRSGVNKSPLEKERIKEYSKKRTRLAIDFQKNVIEEMPTIKFTKDELVGCPKDFIESNLNKDGLVEIRPVSSAVLTITQNCTRKATREKVLHIRSNYCKDSNLPILAKFANQSEELAKIIGFKNYAELLAQDKMTENTENIKRFINELDALTKERALKEVEAIKKYKAESEDNSDFSYSDIDFYSSRIYEKLLEFEDSEVRPYFPYTHVKNSILSIFEEMFNIRFVKEDVNTWHKEVEAYLVKEDEKIIGRIYLDMHPRKNKYTHACQISIRQGEDNKTIPEGVLICNFIKPSKTDKGLQSSEEVSTFFHEFGHLIHTIFGGQTTKWPSLGGTNVQDDFAEAPSQLLEDLLLDESVFRRLSSHTKTGKQIPESLVQKIVKREHISSGPRLKGLAIARQVALCRIAVILFTEKNITPERIFEAEQKACKESMTVYGDYSGASNFEHLVGDNYASNYYTYMWSLAISKDLFTKFNKNNLLDRKVAEHYRKTILEPGGSKPAAELVKDFLGREWNMDAFKKYLKEGEELLEKI